MKLSDFERMLKVGNLERLNKRLDPKNSKKILETFKDKDESYFQLDRENRRYRSVYTDRLETGDWMKVDD